MSSSPYAFALLSALALAGLPCRAAASKAYVALCCSTPATISVLDAGSGAAVAEFPSAVGATVMAPTPDRTAIYALTQLYNGVPGEGWGPTPGAVNSIVVLDINGGPSSTVIPLTSMPFAIAFSPSGGRAYVAAIDASYGSHLLVVDTQTRQVLRDQMYPQSKFGPGVQMVVTSDGSLLYLTTYGGEDIWKIDTQTLQVTEGFACLLYCQGLALVEQEKTLLTVVSGTTVDYVDTASFQVTRQLPWPLPSGAYAGGVIAVSPDGATAYIGSNPFTAPAGSVAGLDIAAGTFTPVLTGMGIDATAAVSPDGAYLITDSLPTTLSILSLTPTMADQPQNAITLSNIGSAFFSGSGDRIYVLNSQSSYVAEVDVDAGRVTGRIPAGATPVALACEPGRGRLYVANQMSGVLSAIETATSKPVGNFAIPWTGQYPHSVAAAGDHVFVAALEALEMLELKTGTFQRLSFPNAGLYPLYRGLAASPDSLWVYMPFTTATRQGLSSGKIQQGVNVYDAKTGVLTKQIALPGPEEVAFSPAGANAYVGSLPPGGGMELAVIDTTQQVVQSTIPIPAVAEIDSMAVTPDGMTIYLLDRPAAMVYVVDLVSGETIASIPIEGSPASLAISPDGIVVYVTDRAGPLLTVIGTATNTVTGTIPVGTGSTAVVFLAE